MYNMYYSNHHGNKPLSWLSSDDLNDPVLLDLLPMDPVNKECF